MLWLVVRQWQVTGCRYTSSDVHVLTSAGLVVSDCDVVGQVRASARDQRPSQCVRLQSYSTHTHTHTHTRLIRTTQVSWYQKDKTNLDFTEATDSEWQWHQLGHMQACTSLQTDNHASTPPLSLLQAGCPSCRPANSVKALKVLHRPYTWYRQKCDKAHAGVWFQRLR